MNDLNNKLVGLSLENAEEYLREKSYEYFTYSTCGGKDKELLDEPYVVRVKLIENKLAVLVSHFKTMI